MTLWQTSLTYQIWVWLCDVYEDSTLHRFLAAAGRWCSGQIEESRILRPLCREGIVARSWKDSFLCRVLSALVNLPPLPSSGASRRCGASPTSAGTTHTAL